MNKTNEQCCEKCTREYYSGCYYIKCPCHTTPAHQNNFLQVSNTYHCMKCHRDLNKQIDPIITHQDVCKKEITTCGKINGKDCEFATPEVKEDWEKEFEARYLVGEFGDFFEKENRVPLKAIKAFIRTLLTQAREEEAIRCYEHEKKAYEQGRRAGIQEAFNAGADSQLA